MAKVWMGVGHSVGGGEDERGGACFLRRDEGRKNEKGWAGR